jgi:hypothetical protein
VQPLSRRKEAEGGSCAVVLEVRRARNPRAPQRRPAGADRSRQKWLKSRLGRTAWAVSLLLLLDGGTATAADLFGLGSRDAALVGAVSTICQDGSASWYNPAALSLSDQGQMSLVYIGMWPRVSAQMTDYGSLGRIPTYQVEDESGKLSEAMSKGAVRDAVDEAADLERFSAIGVNFNLRFHSLFPRLPFRLNLGANLLIPIEASSGGLTWILAKFEAHNADQPFFPTWNAPFNQARINLALSAELWKKRLWLGAGAAIHSKVKGAVTTVTPVASYDAENPAKNPPAASQASTTQRLGLDAAATVGILGRPLNRNGHEGLISFVYHAQEETAVDLDIDARMELDLGDPIRMEIPYIMAGSFAYRPHRLLGGLAYRYKGTLTLTVELQYAFWSKFEDHFQVLEMEVPAEYLEEGNTLYLDDLGGMYRVKTEAKPWIYLRDTWEPRIGFEYAFPFGLALRLGYAYRQSPLEPDQRHMNMFLDNNWHVVGAGLGYRAVGKADRPGPQLVINAHFQGLFLEPRYNYVGRRGEDDQPVARGIVHTEGFIAGFGLEIDARF